MTNRDQKDNIRARMAETGERWTEARRRAATAGEGDPGDNSHHLIEVEVGTDGAPAGVAERKGIVSTRHLESFWGRWVIEPEPQRVYQDPSGTNRSVYYGVAQTRRGRIAVFCGKGYPPFTAESIATDYRWEGYLDDYDALADAPLPPDLKRQAAALLVARDIVHRDI